MEYDINIHLPSQVENFMNAFAKGDSVGLERIKKNIMVLIPNGSFHKDVSDYELKRHERINELMNKAIESVKNKATTVKGEKAIVDIQMVLKQLEMDLNGVEGDYWSTINEYMITWLNSQSSKP